MSSRPGRMMAWRIVAAILTIVLVMAFVAAVSLYSPLSSWVDQARGDAGVPQTVGASQMEMYCPARMTLADAGAYGDEEFRSSEGDIASSARFVAVGSVYRADTTGLDGKSSVEDIPSATGSKEMSVLSAKDGDALSRLLSGRAVGASRGTGVSGTRVSWATQGDLRGISSSACVTGAMTQSLMVSGTKVGTTQQLILANSSSTPTTVTLAVRGSEKTGAVVLSTGGTVTVPAEGEKIVDLSAAAPSHAALFLTLSSSATPVSAVVRTVAMNGLESRGSDFSTPLDAAAKRTVMAGMLPGDSVRMLLFSRSDATVSASWLTRSGRKDVRSVELTSGRVSSIDVGDVPKDAYALEVRSSSPLYASSVASRAGDDGQADFAFIPSSSGHHSAAVALPEGVSGRVVLANGSNAAIDATIRAVDSDGSLIGTSTVSLAGGESRSVSLSDEFPHAAAVMVSAASPVVWGVRLSASALSDDGLAAVSYVGSTALEPTNMVVTTYDDRSIVR
ncbi:MAG: DUF5719 family protein [Bifidobacterium minimum]|nr:DUF5719 family protein [Bifidobacterium minimum]